MSSGAGTGSLSPGLYKFICAACLVAFPVMLEYTGAQDHSVSPKKISLSEALVSLSEQFDANIAFDAEQLGTVYTRSIPEGMDVEKSLDQVLENSGYRFVKKHNAYLIITDQGAEADTFGLTRTRLHCYLSDRQTREPLSWANIYLPEENRLLIASIDGSFTCRDVSSGELRMVISHIGYHSVDTVITTAGQSPDIRIDLQRKSEQIPPVKIRSIRTDMLHVSEEAGMTRINPARFTNLPNFGETDIFHSLDLLPGISYSKNSSELNIRGGYGDQNLVMLDGFTLYHLDHFFGAFSSVNPNVVKEMEVYKGGYGPEFGERVSGIIDIEGKSGDDPNPVFRGGINLLGGNLSAEVPLGGKLSLVAAGRTGYTSIFSNYLIENIYEDQNSLGDGSSIKTSSVKPDYHYYDLNLKVKYRMSEREQLSVTAYGGKDYLMVSDEVERKWVSTIIEDENSWDNYGLGTSWSRQWNYKYSSDLQMGFSGYQNRYFNSVTASPGKQRRRNNNIGKREVKTVESSETNELNDLYLTLKNSFQINTIHSLKFGIISRQHQIQYENTAGIAYIPAQPGSRTWLVAAYAEDRMQLHEQLQIRPGLRMNYYGSTGKTYLEPRLSLSYSDDAGVLFKLAAGRYYQFMTRVSSDQSFGYNRDFWVLADEANHPVLASNHLIGGFTASVEDLSFDVEAWYKSFDGLQKLLYITEKEPPVSTAQQPAAQQSRISSQILTGTGQSYGIDFLAKYKLSRFESWASYSYSRSIQNFDQINLGRDIPAPYDQPHSFDWTNMYRYGNWHFAAVYVFATGQPFIAHTVTTENLGAGRLYRRLPDYHRVDVSANYNFTLGRINFKAGASIINLFDRENLYDIDRRKYIFDDTSFEETSIIKSQGIMPNVFLHFRF